MLAAAGLDGCIGATLTARGFSFDVLADLVRDGFTTARRETRVQLMRVTSRDIGRWVTPKGWPIGPKAPHASAAREALEEAGDDRRSRWPYLLISRTSPPGKP
jgi:8-oxo-dGTP pyrophosphatase MutT (NUDIX family)